jgi:hypothetical protein
VTFGKKKIWKYPLVANSDWRTIKGRQVIEMPGNARILTVQVQGDTPCLWALVEVGEPPRARGIQIYGTGHQADDAGVYIGTFQLAQGQLVFHVFEDRDDPHPSHDPVL